MQKLGRFTEAEARFRAAFEQAPHYVDAWGSLGCLLEIMDNFDQGLACLRQANRLNPNRSKIIGNLVDLLNKNKRPMEAIDRLQKAIAAEKRTQGGKAHPGLYNNLANAYALCVVWLSNLVYC